MPGMKDFVSVKTEKRIKIQKRLIFCNLREAYKSFKTKHTVGFYKLADLRPKECVLAGARTHMQSVCTAHQNVKLMWIGAKLSLMILEDIPLKSYKHSLAQMMCNPLPECHMGECAQCSKRSTFKEQLNALMEREMVDEVQWVSTDKSILETIYLKINIKNNRQFNLKPNTRLVSMFSFQLLIY